MAGKSSVVNLDVDLEVVLQAVSLEEADYSLGVDVILVLGGLHGLGLDQECAREALAACVVACHGQHCGEMLLLTLLVGVEQAHVAFASAPEHVVAAAELYRGVDGVLDLHRRACHHVEVRVGGGAVHVAPVAEHVCRAPEVLDVRALHLALDVCHDLLDVFLVFLDG